MNNVMAITDREHRSAMAIYVLSSNIYNLVG